MVLKRTRVLILTFATAVAFLALTIPGYSQDKPAPKKPGEPKITTATITLGTGDAKFNCYVARPAGDKSAPGLVLIHEWWGLNDWIKKQADRYAALGYVAIAPDLYHGEVAKDAEHAHELMRGLADERAVADMKAAYAHLVKMKQTGGKPIGVMGWCMGGGLALKLAIAEPRVACTVICYGKPVTDVDQLKKIKGPLLGIWGATDRGIEVEPFKKALDEAGAKHTHHIYPSAGHAFLNETNKRGYNKEQAEKAWIEIDGFLASALSQSQRKGASMNIRIRGLHRLPFDQLRFDKELATFADRDATERSELASRARENWKNAWIIVVEWDGSSKLDFNKFAHPEPGPDSQAVWLERELPGSTSPRQAAFFMHFVDPRSQLWYGDKSFDFPRATPAPNELVALMGYQSPN